MYRSHAFRGRLPSIRMSPRRSFDSFARASARGPGGRPGTGEVSAGEGSEEPPAGGSPRDGSGSGASGGDGSAEDGTGGDGAGGGGSDPDASFVGGPAAPGEAEVSSRLAGPAPVDARGSFVLGSSGVSVAGSDPGPGVGRSRWGGRSPGTRSRSHTLGRRSASRPMPTSKSAEAEEQTAALGQMLRHRVAPAPGWERPFQSHPQPFRGPAQCLGNLCRLAERLCRAAERRAAVLPQPAVSLSDALRQVRPPAQEATEPGARLGEPAADEIETEGLLGRRLFGRSRIAAEIESCHEGRAYRSLQSVY